MKLTADMALGYELAARVYCACLGMNPDERLVLEAWCDAPRQVAPHWHAIARRIAEFDVMLGALARAPPGVVGVHAPPGATHH